MSGSSSYELRGADSGSAKKRVPARGDALVAMVTALWFEHCGTASRGLEMTAAPAIGTRELLPALPCVLSSLQNSWRFRFPTQLCRNNQLQFILCQLMREIVQLMGEVFLVSTLCYASDKLCSALKKCKSG